MSSATSFVLHKIVEASDDQPQTQHAEKATFVVEEGVGRYSQLNGSGEVPAGSPEWVEIAAHINTSVSVQSPTEATAILSDHKIASTAISTNLGSAENLKISVISYADFVEGAHKVIEEIKKALREDGIVGIRGIPGYQECTRRYIEAARAFAALDPAVKQKYVPDRDAGKWLGFEVGKEKFVRDDGTKVIDDAKASYYAYVNHGNLNLEDPLNVNIWPSAEECDLEPQYMAIGDMMFKMGKEVLKKVGHICEDAGISLDVIHGVGRMLHYKSSPDNMNPHWCGAHFDHGLFTALLPAFYYKDGAQIPEPAEAGLFVQRPDDERFYKVVSDDPEVMLFQTGQFAQLATDGLMQATKHRVHAAKDSGVERFTMAVFLSPEYEATIRSVDRLVTDPRYQHTLDGTKREDGLCKYLDWHVNSIKFYEAKN